MIQIIAGTFGYYNGRKLVPITHESGPQQFDPELEARLVKDGVAEYVNATKEGAAGAGDPNGDGLPEYTKEMKLEELKTIAAAYGVDASAMRKKDDVIAAIDAKKAEGSDSTDDEDPDDKDPDDKDPDDEDPDKQTDGDNEEPPQLGAADPV